MTEMMPPAGGIVYHFGLLDIPAACLKAVAKGLIVDFECLPPRR
jgi:hypothetical protein